MGLIFNLLAICRDNILFSRNLFKEGVVSEQKYDETKAQYDAAIATEKAAKSQYDMAVKGAQKEDIIRC